MKILKIIFTAFIIAFVSDITLSQTYDGAFHELFFGPQPSGRSEAMGRSISSIPGDPNSYFFNPAGLAALNGMNINGGGSSSHSGFDNYPAASLGYGGASWKFGKTVTLGFSAEVFNTGEFYQTYTIKTGDTVSGKFNNSIENYRLTICSEAMKDFFAGGNLNFFAPEKNFGLLPLDKGNQSGPYLFFDLGILKAFKFGSKNLKQDLNISASLINVNSAGYKYSTGQNEGKLPSIMRIGSSFNLLVNRAFNFLINVEYEDVLNSKNFEGLHTGFEFSLDPLLYLRAGYYTQDIPDKDIHRQFTFGVGINILLPVYFAGMEKMPSFKIIFDYSHLNLPSFEKEIQENNKSDLYTITLTKWF